MSANQQPLVKHCIAFVIEALTVGGAEQMLVAMANRFSDRGWDVHVICLTKAGALAEQLHPAVTIHLGRKKPGIDFSLAVRLRRIIQSINPDVINSHLWTANLWTRLALPLSSRPIIVTEHSRDNWKKTHERFIDRVLALWTAKLVAVSHDTADFYRATVSIPDRQITVINNGIDTAAYQQGNGGSVREELGIAPETFLIGTVGRLVSAKNHVRLLEMADKLQDQLDSFRVVLVGEGEERSTLEAVIRKHKLHDIVIMTGERKDIGDVLDALDVFVLSSDREGHPLTALEAQTAGTPVVLTNAGGSADAIAGYSGGEASPATVTGGVLVQKSAQSLADAIAKLAKDPELLRSMGEYAREYAPDGFSLDRMVSQYEKLFLSSRK